MIFYLLLLLLDNALKITVHYCTVEFLNIKEIFFCLQLEAEQLSQAEQQRELDDDTGW